MIYTSFHRFSIALQQSRSARPAREGIQRIPAALPPTRSAWGAVRYRSCPEHGNIIAQKAHGKLKSISNPIEMQLMLR
jgi:hypothetical protein